MDVFAFAIGVTLVLFLVCLIGEWGHERAMRRQNEYPVDPLDAVLQKRREDRDEERWRTFAKIFEKYPYLCFSRDEITAFHMAMGTMRATTVRNRIDEYVAQKKLQTIGEDFKNMRYALSDEERKKFLKRIENEVTNNH